MPAGQARRIEELTGDENEQCLKPGLLMKRTIPTAGLVVMLRAGHTLNLEDPAFNRVVGRLAGVGVTETTQPSGVDARSDVYFCQQPSM